LPVTVTIQREKKRRTTGNFFTIFYLRLNERFGAGSVATVALAH
jgi:hypothetical protein